jgi:hypothetical protein
MGNKALATYGRRSMPRVPNKTTLATANAISCSLALMIGASADIAVTPQIEHPAATRVDMRGGSPSLLPTHGITVKPVPV